MKDWSEHKVKNKIKTAGYFIKRLKDNGFVVLKMFNAYSEADPRRWSILVDPGYHSVFITCFTNKDEKGEVLFNLMMVVIILKEGFISRPIALNLLLLNY